MKAHAIRTTSTWAAFFSAVLILSFSAGPARAQLPTLDQQKCITTVNKAAAKVAKTMRKSIAGCIKTAESGGLPPGEDVATCVLSDPRNKLGKAKNKVSRAFVTKCTSPPAFGSTDSATVNGVTVAQDDALAADLFGSDYVTAMSIADGTRCRSSVAKAYGKLGDSIYKTFNGCKKDVLSAGSATSAADLETCLDVVANDANGKIGRIAEKIALNILSRCDFGALGATFPGACAVEAAGLLQFSNCVERTVRCRSCFAINGADGLSADCDLFDDQLPNTSCAVPTTTTTTSTTTTTTTTTTTLPLPPCASAAAPTCAGDCPAGEGCFDQGGNCGCEPTTTTTTTTITTTTTSTTTTTTSTTLPQIQVRTFPNACVDVLLNNGLVGLIPVKQTGTVVLELDFSTLGDSDFNGLEEILFEMTSFDFVASDPTAGTITVSLADQSQHLLIDQRTFGVIEETTNNNPGVLDIPPHALVGSATAEFDLFLKAVIVGTINNTIHHDTAIEMQAAISNEPPASGELFTMQNAVPVVVRDPNEAPFLLGTTIDSASLDLDAVSCE